MGLGKFPSWLMANIFQYMPLFRPITRDNYRSLQVDSICDKPFPNIFAITPASIDEVVPGYLADAQSKNQYAIFRQHAGRDK